MGQRQLDWDMSGVSILTVIWVSHFSTRTVHVANSGATGFPKGAFPEQNPWNTNAYQTSAYILTATIALARARHTGGDRRLGECRVWFIPSPALHSHLEKHLMLKPEVHTLQDSASSHAINKP